MAEKQLARVMSPVSMLAMATGIIVGPWLVMMPWWFSLTGSSISLAFVLTAIVVVPIGYIYAELCPMLPYTGGSFIYAGSAMGPVWGFIGGWVLLLPYVGVVAFQTMATVELIKFLWFPDMGFTQLLIVAIIWIVFFCLLNSYKLITSAQLQFFFFIVLAVIAFIVEGILFPASGQWSTSNLQPFFATGSEGFLIAFGLMISMYFGFDCVPQLVEESNFDLRLMPKIIIGSIFLSMLIYVVVCLAIGGMRDWQFIKDTPFVEAVVGDQVFGPAMKYFIALGALGAIFTCFNGFWISCTRIFYSMGRSNLMPRKFGELNKWNIPGWTNIPVAVLALIMILLSGTAWLEIIFTVQAIGIILAYFLTCIASVVLRTKHPEWKRPYKMPGGIIMSVLGLICCSLLFYYSAQGVPKEGWFIIFVYLLIGLAIYGYMGLKRKQSPEEYTVFLPEGVVEQDKGIKG
ncbi:MAG: APC family permease [Bacillota bacterium]